MKDASRLTLDQHIKRARDVVNPVTLGSSASIEGPLAGTARCMTEWFEGAGKPHFMFDQLRDK
jgi:hypothetical protein